MYEVGAENEVEKIITKLLKKDKTTYEYLKKKIKQISEDPYIGKPLHYILKGMWRVHIGPFVLIYKIIEKEKKIVLLKFDHHDNVYKT